MTFNSINEEVKVQTAVAAYTIGEFTSMAKQRAFLTLNTTALRITLIDILLENKPATISRNETCGRYILAGI